MKVSAAHYSLYSVMLGSDLHIATGKRPLRGGHFGVLTGRSWPGVYLNYRYRAK